MKGVIVGLLAMVVIYTYGTDAITNGKWERLRVLLSPQVSPHDFAVYAGMTTAMIGMGTYWLMLWLFRETKPKSEGPS